MPTVEITVVHELMDRYGSDVRSMEEHLYESFQAMLEIEHAAL